MSLSAPRLCEAIELLNESPPFRIRIFPQSGITCGSREAI
jgi:hypothetical protein